ncbi:MAG: formylglycine-generating enzyme family protein, partial [Pirellulaceae bacterium]|nr:formylglycine-generating enzyme family protein [Pirellulaceae bacterium]
PSPRVQGEGSKISRRETIVEKIRDIYRTSPDPGLHAASEWLLRQWKDAIWIKQTNDAWASDQEQRDSRLDRITTSLTNENEKPSRQWFVNGQGQTMVIIPGPVEFRMGSPVAESGHQAAEKQHNKRIGRTFAIAATPVTTEQFLRFDDKFGDNQTLSSEPTCPIGRVTWYEAAAYCNWLSKEEKIPEDQWVYEFTAKETKLNPNYLSLTGYRLPTEAEMEFATRAGAETSRYFGETDKLLSHYAWFDNNYPSRIWPVGNLKANDFGFFDVYGNVFTWCQDRSSDVMMSANSTNEDKEGALVVTSTSGRKRRGGSANMAASSLRSANRSSSKLVPTARSVVVGFRVARTYR